MADDNKAWFDANAEAGEALARGEAGVSREVSRYVRPDKRQIVRLVELDSGLFSFTVESELWEDAHPAIGEGHWYWCGEERGNGIYDTREVAQRELAAQFPWTRQPGEVWK